MRFSDLIKTCISNLRRRRVRTLLTVLGVVIGTTSVVIMLSLGFGMNKLNEELFASFGSMNIITINNYYGNDDPSKFLTDETVTLLSKLDHVEFVSPQLSTSVIMKQGLYEADIQLRGVTSEYMEKLLKLGNGTLPKSDGSDLSIVMGNQCKIQFRNSKTNKGYYDTNEMPDVDYDSPLFTTFDTSSYYKWKAGDSSVAVPKKYMLKVSGVTEGDEDTWNDYSYNAYVNIDALKNQLKKVYKNKPIEGQPLTKKGKPYKYYVYNQMVVYVDDMKNVIDVQKTINNMGYQGYSNMEWLEQSKEQTNMIRTVLGGIGAVSLLVAAIGITNTMMMSIYERTKEIGIMKVLGCDMREIRNMFLIESGFIGLLGGIAGCIFSLSVSYIVNKFIGGSAFIAGANGDISVIPVWLLGASIIFAILISMFAGLIPSIKAMKLSPLTAIRNE